MQGEARKCSVGAPPLPELQGNYTLNNPSASYPTTSSITLPHSERHLTAKRQHEPTYCELGKKTNYKFSLTRVLYSPSRTHLAPR